LVNNILFADANADHRVALFTVEPSDGYWLHGNDLFCGAQPCALVDVYSSSGVRSIPRLDEVEKCAWGDCVQAAGDISADPLLTGPNDFHLLAGSPCIDAGVDPTDWYTGQDVYLDLDGDTRPLGWTWDIGADEFQ
jgi:hypothetical protein